MDLPEFKEFGKIGRLSRDVVVTEKIDGTNGVVYVGEDGQVLAGSRSRWIVPLADNFGFAAWVEKNAEDLRAGLGPGYHYGEWWGSGIGRRYGVPDKRFSLFNVARWSETRPACCLVVPVLYAGPFDTRNIDEALARLAASGSLAAPGFMKPEGIVVYHRHSNTLFKKTVERDDEPKSMTATA